MKSSSAQQTILFTVGGTVCIVYVARLASAPIDSLRQPGQMLRIGFGGAIAITGLMILAEASPELATAIGWLVLVGGVMSYGSPAFQAVSKVVGNKQWSYLAAKKASSSNVFVQTTGDNQATAASWDMPGVGGDPGGIVPEFQSRLDKLIADAPGSVTINSGYRSYAEQEALWNDALSKYGSADAARQWVAPPGNSNHNKGLAADLGFQDDATLEWVHAHAADYGLNFPLDNEDWHIEPIGIR